jgi:hypothetical protein
MSEQVVAPAEAVDPFEGKEVSFEEFSNYRKTGEVPERIKAEAPKEPPAAQAETVDGEEPAKEAEQEQRESDRDSKGRFAAKPKVEFNPDQQEILNREIKRAKDIGRRQAEETLRGEYEKKYAPKTSETQVTAADKKPRYTAQDFLSQTPPPEPEEPIIMQFDGTLEQFTAAQKQAREDLKLWVETRAESVTLKREQEARAAEHQKRLDSGLKKITKAHPDYEDELASLTRDVNEKAEHAPQDLFDFITYKTDIPHEILYHLCKNREDLRDIVALPPEKAVREIYRLEDKLTLTAAPAPDKKPAEPKPKPPAPVGGRASATAFDVSDTSLSPDEWARQRNEQLAKRRGR